MEWAISDFTRAIGIEPDDSDTYNNRGWCYKKLGLYENAISDFTRAIGIDPDDSDTYNNRGWCYNELELYEDAISDFTRAIGIDPDDADAYYNRGVSKELAGLPYCSDYKRACDLHNKSGCGGYHWQCN